MQNDKARIEFIHLLRALAPLIVLWVHIPGWWLAERGMTWLPYELTRQYITAPLGLFQEGGHLGVVIFFLISGFIISHVAVLETRTEFVIKRIMRIVPPVIFAITVAALLQGLSHKLDLPSLTGNTATSASDYILSALLLNWFVPGANYVMTVTWSLIPELVFYSTILLIIPILKSRPLLASYVVLAIATLVAQVKTGQAALDTIATNSVYLPMFIVGRVAFLWHYRIGRRLNLIVLLCASSIAFIYCVASSSPLLISKAWTTYVVALVAFGAAQAWDPKRIPKAVTFFGDISYPMYLLHIPIGAFLLNVTSSIGLNFSLSYVITFCAIVGASWLSWVYVDKPFQRLARSLVRHVTHWSVYSV